MKLSIVYLALILCGEVTKRHVEFPIASELVHYPEKEKLGHCLFYAILTHE